VKVVKTYKKWLWENLKGNAIWKGVHLMDKSTSITTPSDQATVTTPSAAASFNVAEYIIQQLAAWGVKRIYGVIGDANLSFLDALDQQNVITYYAVSTENAAALMASAESKLTGRLAVCLATSGPGVANLINGLADAYSDGASVLAITGQVETKKIGTDSKQYVDQQKLVSPVVSYTTLLTNPDALPNVMKKAMTVSLLQGTVSHISVPKDLFLLPVKGDVYPYESHLHQPVSTPGNIVHQAAQKMKTAQKPMILVGQGVKNVSQLAVQLAEKWSAGIITTQPAKKLIPNQHRLYCGGLGQAGSEASSDLLKESDMVLILGATWWPEDYVPDSIKIIQVDQSAMNIGSHRQVEMGVVGDMAHVLPMLLQEVVAEHKLEWVNRIEKVKTDWKVRIEAEANQTATPIPPQKVIKILSDVVADDAVISLDVGDHVLWFNRIFQNRNQDILLSGTWRTLGFGIPAAMAAQIEHPNKQIVAVVGDGGVVQTLMDFNLATQRNLPIVVIIMNNGKYAMETNRMKVEGLSKMGGLLKNPDFSAIAAACGGEGYRVEQSDELESVLTKALAERKPTIIDVIVDDTVVPHTKM
jgi:pyruvate oxidase